MVSEVRPPPPSPLLLSSPPPQAATPTIAASTAATPTIVLCMRSSQSSYRVHDRADRSRLQWIQRALNGPDARLPRGGPRADAAGVLAVVGDGREPAHAPGPGGLRRARGVRPGQRGAPARLRLRRAARAR